jgi:hypothetical protein
MLRDSAMAFLGFLDGLMKNFKNFGEWFQRHWHEPEFKMKKDPFLTPFKEWTKKPPVDLKVNFVNVGRAIQAITDQITKREFKLPPIKPPPAPPEPGKKLPPIAAEADKGKEYKLGGALEVGSKEAFSAIARGASGRGSTTDAVKQGVAVQRDIHGAIKQQTQVIKDQAKRQLIEIK